MIPSTILYLPTFALVHGMEEGHAPPSPDPVPVSYNVGIWGHPMKLFGVASMPSKQKFFFTQYKIEEWISVLQNVIEQLFLLISWCSYRGHLNNIMLAFSDFG